MGKKIQIDLTFKADTSAAKQQMQELQQQLSNIATAKMEPVHLNTMRKSLTEAKMKALDLKTALNEATNVNTGRLDFGKFSQQLAKNKMSIKDYAKALGKLGPEGQQAFASLTQAIANSEAPVLRLKGKVAALGKTLANTAKWQISSSFLQGVTSAISGTIDYAKELNESLNNIRIVTGKNEEAMSKFAIKANKAAKQLSTATTEYTNASLIYFQQGLNDSEVAERTATTIKLANAVGKNAEEVSEWMTAIWNNFDDGSQSMEHYGDVLAKLGAATASSADEIAGGLEKFSAVADSVGLSYEYAASALATITAETRQSEDVVGTSLKTIFARVENLKLGEKLEDGTTLGQYSAALEKVGVSIKDTKGGLKDMDDILDEIGARWNGLARDEQVALAQSVAGVRQYNQFIAMMDNYDTMKENVELAKESANTLELQNEIYSQGMEGTTKRVQANMEEIKNTLLDENDLIPLLNIADGFLTVIGDLVKSFGGLPGILSLVGSIGLKIWGPQVTKSIQGAIDGMKNFWYVASGKAQTDRLDMLHESANETKKMVEKGHYGDNEGALINKYLDEQVARKEKLWGIESRLTEEQQEALNLAEQMVKAKEDEAIAVAKTVDEYKKAADAARDMMEHSGQFEGGVLSDLKQGGYDSDTTRLTDDMAKVDEAFNNNQDKLTDEEKDKYNSKRYELMNATSNFEKADAKVKDLDTQIEEMENSGEPIDEEKMAKLKEQRDKADAWRTKKQDSMNKKAEDFAKTASGMAPIASELEGQSKLNELEAAASYKSDVAQLEGEHRYDTSKALKADVAKVDTAVNKYRDMLPQELQDKYDKEKAQLDQSMSNFDKADTAAKGATDERKKAEEEAKKDPKDEKKAKAAEEAKKKEKEAIKVRDQAQKQMREQAKSYATTAKQIDIASKAVEKNTKHIDKNTKEGKDQIKNAEEYVKALEDEIAAQKEKERIDKEVAAEQEAMNQKLEDAAHGQRNMVSAFVNAGQGAMAAVSAYQMVSGAIDNLSTSIVDGEFSLSTLLSTFMSIGMAVPQVMSTFTGMGKALDALGISFKKVDKAQKDQNKTTSIGTMLKKIFTKEGRKQAAEERKRAKEKKKENTEETAGNTGTAMSEVAKKIAENPIMGAIILAAVVAVLGIAVAVSINTKQNEKDKEQAREEAQKEVERLKEEVEKNGELYASYKENLAIYEETGQGKEKLAEAAKKLAEAYNIEGASIAYLTGNYEALTAAADAARVAELKKLSSAAQHSQDLNNETFENAMRDGVGHAEGSGYKADFGQGNTGIVSAVREWQYANKDKELSDLFAISGSDVSITTKTRTGADFAKAYEAVMWVTGRARELGDSSSAAYKEMMSWLAKSQEEYEKYDANQDIIVESEAEVAVLETKSAKGKTVSNINRNDLKDYASYRKAVLGDYSEDSDEYKARIKFLGEQENMAENETIMGAIDDQVKMFANSGQETYDDLVELYANSTDLERTAAAMVKGSDMSMEDFKQKMAANMLAASKANRITQANKEAGYNEEQSQAIYRVLKTYNKELAENEILLNVIATAYTTLNAKADKLSKSWETQSKILLTAEKDSVQYGAALGLLQKDMEEFFNIDDERIDLTNFTHKNLETINKFMQGDLNAYQDLQEAIGKELVSTTYSSYEGLDKLITGIGDISQYAAGETVKLDSSLLSIWNDGEQGEFAIKEIAEAMGFMIENIDGVITATRTMDEEGLEEWAKKQKKALDDLLKSIDRYFTIKQKIEDNNNNKSIYGEFRDDSFGKRQRLLSEAYRQTLVNSIALEQEYFNQAQQYYDEDRKTLLANWNVKLNDQGVIENYTEIATQLASSNKELYNQFVEEAKNYTDSLNLMEEKRRAVAQEKRGLFSEDLAEIARIAQEELDISDSFLTTIEFQLEHIEDKAFNAAEALKALAQRSQVNLKSFNASIKEFNDILALTLSSEEIQRLMAGDTSVLEGKTLTKEQIDQLKDSTNSAIEQEMALRTDRIEMQEQLNDEIDTWNEKIDEGRNKIEDYKDVLSSFKNIIELVGRETVGVTDTIMSSLRQSQVENARSSLVSSKSVMDANKKILDDAEAKLSEARASGNELAIKQWEETVKKARDNYRDSLSQFKSDWEDALTSATETFAENVEDVANSFSEAIGGSYGSIENMREAFDRQMKVSEYYLQNFEKSYEISKLNRKINEKLDKTDNLVAQSRLVDLQQDLLKMNREGEKVSQRDIEYMQKKYDLIVAEAAFKDAQNAKSLVRLKRDSEGNFGYMYTSDAAATEQAKQGYEDALYALQKFSDDTNKELAELLVGINEEAYAALQELGDMSTWTQEEWTANISKMRNEYGEDIAYILQQYESLLTKNQKSNTQYYAGLAQTFKDTYISGIYPDYNNFVKLQSDLTEQLGKHCENATTAFTNMRINITAIFGEAGLDGTITGFGDTVFLMSQTVIKDSENAAIAITGMSDEMVTAISGPEGIIASIQAWDYQWGETYKTISEQAKTLSTVLSGILTYYQQIGEIDLSEYSGDNDLGGDGQGQQQKGWDNVQSLASDKVKGMYNNANNLGTYTTKDGTEFYRIQYSGKDKDGNIKTQTAYLTKENLFTESGGSVESPTKLGQYVYFDPSKGQQLDDLKAMDNTGKHTSQDVLVSSQGALYVIAEDGYAYGLGYTTLNRNTVKKGAKFDLKMEDAPKHLYVKDSNGYTVSFYGIGEKIAPKGPNATIDMWKDVEDQDSFWTRHDGWAIYGPDYNNQTYGNYQMQMRTGKIRNIQYHNEEFWYSYDVDDYNANGLSKSYELWTPGKYLSSFGFDTGGYTGSWGPEGRLAFLHQKEIVLNAHDTENFLAAIGIVRDISDQIERNAIAMQYANSLSNYRTNITGLHDTIQQDVHITAEFPNATDHSEIEEAFRNLTNYASQYVFRR